jgi:hypothetical protein
VGECSRDELGWSWQLAFARKTRGDIETRELRITCFTYEDIVRLDVLMDQPLWWTSFTAAVMAKARGRKRPVSIGTPIVLFSE